jgi:acyl-CoA reductase-like NAD-dependent aldehyde dehydrogenase
MGTGRDLSAGDRWEGVLAAGEAVRQALGRARAAQVTWSLEGLRARLGVIGRARRLLAEGAEDLAALLAVRRPAAETLVAEVLPLLEAARFLARAAPRLLANQALGTHGRPAWLAGVSAEVRREPLGVVLVLAPSNYPLFLPGVQILQALAAGNAVCVKPARDGTRVLSALADALARAGLPEGLLQLLGEDSGKSAVAAGFDHIVLTGAAETGIDVLRTAAETLTPCTMELSGNDAVFVLPEADLALVAAALAYGMRLNGGATCIAPRRVFVPRAQAANLERLLLARLAGAAAMPVGPGVAARLDGLLREAEAAGARLSGRPTQTGVPPIIVAEPPAGARLLREDVFAPVLAILPVADMMEALARAAECPYALGASIWGPEPLARALAARVNAGSVVINDLIVPTADPRLAFGGRGRSGFGVTRGAEGLLAMTAIKTVSVRRGRFRPHLLPPRPRDAERSAALIRLLHAASALRFAAVMELLRTMRRG